MNAYHRAQAAYSPANAPVRTDRSTEYEAFVRVTRRLSTSGRDAADDFKGLVEAIDANRRLWSLLAESVADKANLLPADLRARILYLAEFTAHHSRRVLRREAGPEILIDVNTAIMRGLRSQDGAS